MIRALVTLAFLATLSFSFAALVVAAIVPARAAAGDVRHAVVVGPSGGCPALPNVDEHRLRRPSPGQCPMGNVDLQALAAECPVATAAAAAGCPAFADSGHAPRSVAPSPQVPSRTRPDLVASVATGAPHPESELASPLL